MARTKLICTLGPASATPKLVEGLVRAGTSVFRLNFSHGDPDGHARMVELVRGAERSEGRPLAVLVDLPGPKVRLGALAPDPFPFKPGQRFDLRPAGAGDERGAATTYPALAQDLRVGDRVLLADGAVELSVAAIDEGVVRTACVRGGSVRSGQGVNVPAERLSLPAVTDRDREGLARALDLGADLIAQSFVRSPEDVRELRAVMADRIVPIVAKIETRPAVQDVDRILDEADALMIARGDLGVELPMEEIPLIQKDLVRKARAAGRPAIVATQMLESMISAPRPTRAETTDVANAVLDGADAVMLSGETAVGSYPFESAAAATTIAAYVETRGAAFRGPDPPPRPMSEGAAVAHAVGTIAFEDLGIVAITCYTETGRTARLLSGERPGVPVYAFIPPEDVRRSACLLWGVEPLPAEPPEDTDGMIGLMDRGLRERGLAEPGDAVVMAASSPAGRTTTNMLKIHTVGMPVR
ncbi:MAG TPA: pyruvate kinase [Actinomycetota bacterium]|nr:pyruvate kinase [Actinomycetota bacterium]